MPDLVRRAFGDLPDQPAGRGSDAPSQSEMRAGARAALIERGHLTEEELDSLSVDEAIGAALARMGEQIAALQEQTALLDSRDRGQTNAFSRPPKTLHRR